MMVLLNAGPQCSSLVRNYSLIILKTTFLHSLFVFREYDYPFFFADVKLVFITYKTIQQVFTYKLRTHSCVVSYSCQLVIDQMPIRNDVLSLIELTVSQILVWINIFGIHNFRWKFDFFSKKFCSPVVTSYPLQNQVRLCLTYCN